MEPLTPKHIRNYRQTRAGKKSVKQSNHKYSQTEAGKEACRRSSKKYQEKTKVIAVSFNGDDLQVHKSFLILAACRQSTVTALARTAIREYLLTQATDLKQPASEP